MITVAAPSNQQLAARCLQPPFHTSTPTALWTRPYLHSFYRREGVRANVVAKHKASSVQGGSESTGA